MSSRQRSIQDCFRRASERPRKIACPACGAQVVAKEINRHLDSPELCRPDQAQEEEDASSPPPREEEEEEDDDEGGDDDVADPGGRVGSTLARSYSFDDCVPRRFSSPSQRRPYSSSQDSSSSSCSSPALRASRSVSRTPKKFSGVEALRESGKLRLSASPSPRRTRGSRFSPLPKGGRKAARTPEKARRVLFEGGASPPPASSSHVPFTQSKRRDPHHVPYYVVNFEHVLRCVVDETDDRELLEEGEVDVVEAFRRLPLDARKLYVRLFQRKLAWLQRAQLEYEEVADTEAALDDLVQAGLITDGNSLDDLETLLKLLPAAKLKALAKDFLRNGLPQSKGDLVKSLCKHSRQKGILSFAKNARDTNPIEKKVKTKARLRLGSCYRLHEEPRKLFLRVLSLFSLSNWWDEREGNGQGQQPAQLTTILLVNQGKLTFPNYDIIRETKLFRCRGDLLEFEEACAQEATMSEAFEKKDWEEALIVYRASKEMFAVVLEDPRARESVEALPRFLRRFTRGAVLAYVLTKGIEVLERQKSYGEVVGLIEFLLAQETYLPHYHGHWYERLVLDLDLHLRRPGDALRAIERGLGDRNVREARKLSLVQRANMICNRKSLKGRYADRLQDFEACHSDWAALSGLETPSEKVRGRLINSGNAQGGRTTFRFDVSGGESLLCSVEEFVRNHFKRERGLKNGLHGEGSVVNSVCGLLFWDIIYDTPLPDVFRSPNQGTPLDLDTDDFYANRKALIDSRLDSISSMSSDEVAEEARACWQRRHGVVSVVNWDLFVDAEYLCGLLRCLTGPQVAGVCRRLLADHRHTRSGFPDLTLWDPESRRCEIVEVKGPGDRLSNKQILWIRYLNKLGVKAFVCHVEAVGAKKLLISPQKKEKVTPKKNTPEKRSSTEKMQASPSPKRARRKRRNSDEEASVSKRRLSAGVSFGPRAGRTSTLLNDSDCDFQ